MKIKWVYIAIIVIALTGCARSNSTDVKAGKAEDFMIYEKELTQLDTILLTDKTDETEILSETDPDVAVLDENIDAGMIEKLYLSDDLSTDEMEEVEEFIYEVGNIYGEILWIWENHFEIIYHDTTHHLKENIDNEILEEMSEAIENLYEEYDAVEDDLNELNVSSDLSEETQNQMINIMNELQMAIDNRTLALIEFKSMMHVKEDTEQHNELLAIHVENSDKYLNRVDSHLLELTE